MSHPTQKRLHILAHFTIQFWENAKSGSRGPAKFTLLAVQTPVFSLVLLTVNYYKNYYMTLHALKNIETIAVQTLYVLYNFTGVNLQAYIPYFRHKTRVPRI